MDDLVFLVIMGVYLFSAIFFAVISRKCFIRTKKIPKIIASVILSPSVGYFISFLVSMTIEDNVFMTEDFFSNQISGIRFALNSTGTQLLIQMVFMFLYIKIMNAKNPSIAMFVYLCSMAVIPSIVYLASFDDVTGLGVSFVYIVLHILFYVFAIRPLKDMTDTKQKTDKRLFIGLPGINFLFNTVVFILFMYSFYVSNLGYDMAAKFTAIKNLDIKIAQDTLQVLHLMIVICKYQTHFMLLPSIFVTLVVIITFSIIVKNIKYMNETIAAKDAIKELSVEVMEALAHTIDAKDEYTKGHSIRVAKYSRMIAEQMGLDPEQCENVYYMGLLHDLGKIGVPNEIINKPAPLSDEEYEVIKTHPGTGFNILSEMKSRPDLAIGAHWHHERYDGKGYPDHKKGEEIPLEARIIAVADCYDAMTSNRSYRHYLEQDKVKAELRRVAGTQLDSRPVEAMIRIMDADPDYTMHE